MTYQFDPRTREYVAQLLYEAIPALYKLDDQQAKHLGEPERAELERFVKVLAGPLATVRQSIEELHADFFIDTANDWVIPYLARMIGLRLVFPDADSNRRDVRNAVGWRRRKGPPATLQELGNELTGQLVVTDEGWKRVQLAQDLDLLRFDRLVPDLRPPSIAERAEGPMGTAVHAVDVRLISRFTGKYHPKHVTHWVHPTKMFQIEDGTPADLRDPATDPDLRFSFHPLGEFLPLRARQRAADDALKTDRVPPMIFAEGPAPWYGVEGRFDVRICGVSAALAAPEAYIGPPTRLPAEADVLAGTVTMALLQHDGRRFAGGVWIELIAAPFPGGVPDLPDTGAAAIQQRGRLLVDQTDTTTLQTPDTGALPGGAMAMIRLVPDGGALARRFPGATIAITGGAAAARLGSTRGILAQNGTLRGALVVEVPETNVDSERWFYLGADGSLFDAQSTGAGAVDLAVDVSGTSPLFEEATRATTGPGPAWPPSGASSDPMGWARLPAAPGAGPAVLHGGQVLIDGGGGSFTLAPAATESALVFALTYFDSARRFQPFLRLGWTGPDPSAATWVALGDDGRDVDSMAAPIDVAARFETIADALAGGLNDARLAMRVESSRTDAVLAPAEVSFTAADGRTVLIHAPELPVQAANPDATWAVDAALFSGMSVALGIGRDGSTWRAGTGILLRRSLGPVAPLAAPVHLRRREVHGRSLCQWRNEVPPGLMHAETLPGRLDIDARHGLFSMNLGDGVQDHAPGPDGIQPPNPTVMYQDGYTSHTGARPAAREAEINERLPRPTRLVSASGHLHEDAPNEYLGIPLFRTLADALAAVAAAPAALEVIEFQDSARYDGETVNWPAGPVEIAIQAAERARPVLAVGGWNPGAAAYESLTLTGLALAPDAAGDLNFPPSHAVAIRYLTVLRDDARLLFTLTPGEGPEQVEFLRSVVAGIGLGTSGEILFTDGVIDSGTGAGLVAVDAPLGRVTMERASVVGSVGVEILEASECIFMDDVTVADRFEGCVRYSRVTEPSVLPQRHRVVVDTPVDFVSINRHDPAHMRLAEHCDPAVLKGAEDGGEMGAFHDELIAMRYEAYGRRLIEFTPAGLVSGMIRLD
jgi:hypothetical protein